MRVALDSITRICLAIFYEILSFACWAFSNRLSHHYHSLASYHFEKGAGKLFSSLNFGGEIIDFSLNSSTRIKELLPPSMSEEQALREVYGEKAIDRWLRIETDEFPIKKSALCRKEMVLNGCCLGMCFDFLSSYLKHTQRSQSPLDAIKAIAPNFTDGASDEAQLAQTFYAALDFSLALAKYQDPVQVEAKREQLIANQFGLQLNQTVPYKCNHILDALEPDFITFIDQLPNGAYKVAIMPDSTCGHALLFIKTKNAHFIYDPTSATLLTENAPARIWDISKQFFKKSPSGFISFSAVVLSSHS
jgi:hypothetical protein